MITYAIAVQLEPLLSSGHLHGNKVHCWGKIKGGIHQIAEELMAPPSLAAVQRFSLFFFLLKLTLYSKFLKV